MVRFVEGTRLSTVVLTFPFSLSLSLSPFLFLLLSPKSMILPLPGTSSRHPPRIRDFSGSSVVLSLALFLEEEPRHHCLQAPVCTYVYNNVTHTPRPRLFLLFRVAARGVPIQATQPAFDNRADVPDRHDKRARCSEIRQIETVYYSS